MRGVWCLSVLLLGLVLSRADGAPGTVQKKSLAEDTKIRKSNLEIGETGEEKDRAKKSAAFCVEIRPGAEVTQTSRNCREKKSHEAQLGEQSQQQPATQNGQPGQTVNTVQPGPQTINQAAPGPVQQPAGTRSCFANDPSSTTESYQPQQPGINVIQPIPVDSAVVPLDSLPAENIVTVREPTDNRMSGEAPPSIANLIEQRVSKCIGEAIREFYPPAVPVQVDPVTYRASAPLIYRNAQDGIIYARGSGYAPYVQMRQPGPAPVAPVAPVAPAAPVAPIAPLGPVAPLRRLGGEVSSGTLPESIVQEVQGNYARSGPSPVYSRSYLEAPVNAYRQGLVALEQPVGYFASYPSTGDLIVGPDMSQTIRYIRSSKDEAADEKSESGEKIEKEKSS